MKQNLDLMRRLVLAVEDHPAGTLLRQPSFDRHSQDEVGYHVYLLVNEDLARGTSTRNAGHADEHYLITGLTPAGHEFAELARDEMRWEEVKSEARASGAVTLTIIRQLLACPRPNRSATVAAQQQPGTISVQAQAGSDAMPRTLPPELCTERASAHRGA